MWELPTVNPAEGKAAGLTCGHRRAFCQHCTGGVEIPCNAGGILLLPDRLCRQAFVFLGKYRNVYSRSKAYVQPLMVR